MKTAGIRALKQNASTVVAEAAAGDLVVITDRGRPVAMLMPYDTSHTRSLIEAGLATPPRRSLRELPPPARRRRGQRPLSDVLAGMREAERH